MSHLVDFYLGYRHDHRGRLIEQIWSYDHRALEGNHDYIQWLFPSWMRSQISSAAPLLNEKIQQEFCSDPELQTRLLESLDLMLDFYGLARTDDAICRATHFEDRASNWLSPGNHNHLRLTRILGALWTLGCETQAQQLYRCLESIAEEFSSCVTEKTRAYWAEAARQDGKQQ